MRGTAQGDMDLLVFTRHGIYCPRADIYVDPHSAVQRAVITHAHSDHARPGHTSYLTHRLSAPLLKQRLGKKIQVQAVEYGEPVMVNGVRISLHPAGHIIGSSQVRFEYGSHVWAVSGDYKLEDDSISTPFEPVPCHVFVTESTFGLPVFRWRQQEEVFEEMTSWWRENQRRGLPSVLVCYALGKAQRVLAHIDVSLGPIFAHSAVVAVTTLLKEMGFRIPEVPVIPVDVPRAKLQHALILVPPGFANKLPDFALAPYALGYVSGWMTFSALKAQRALDRGFVLSDHADWDALNFAVESTGAREIIVMHGYTSSFSRWLRERGYDAREADAEAGVHSREVSVVRNDQ